MSGFGDSGALHPEETSTNSDICDFIRVSYIENDW